MQSSKQFEGDVNLIIDEIRSALTRIDPGQLEEFVCALLAAEKVFVVGVGRVMLSLSAFVKRLNHLGVRAHCVGDINEPAISSRDLLVVGSGSGESVVPVAIARVAKTKNARIAYIGSNLSSSVAGLADLVLRIPVKTKFGLPDELGSQQIMTSLFEQALYLLGDAVSLEIVRRRHLDISKLTEHHANLE